MIDSEEIVIALQKQTVYIHQNMLEARLVNRKAAIAA